MYASVVSFLVFTVVFAGAVAGIAMRRALPESHFTPEAKDMVRVAIGLIVTMTGLVLGMLVSSAKTFYDGEKSQVAELSTEIIVLNDLLTAYGPETKQTRIEAGQFVQAAVDRIWPPERSQRYQLRPGDEGQYFYEQIQLLAPKNDAQAYAKTQLLSLTLSMKKTYWLMYLESEQTSIAIPLLVVVTSWLTTIFISFGLFAPRNPTTITTLIICALAASAAIFIIMSMYSPFTGVFKISPVAVREAMRQTQGN